MSQLIVVCIQSMALLIDSTPLDLFMDCCWSYWISPLLQVTVCREIPERNLSIVVNQIGTSGHGRRFNGSQSCSQPRPATNPTSHCVIVVSSGGHGHGMKISLNTRDSRGHPPPEYPVLSIEHFPSLMNFMAGPM